MSQTPFRVRLEWPDGGTADFDVVSINLWAWKGGALEFTTEHGLTIQAPQEPEDEEEIVA